MRKMTILLAICMSLMTMGMLAQASRVGAMPAAVAGEDDSGDTTVPAGSGSPSGGVATGAGGTAPSSSNTAPWLAAGAAGIALSAVALAHHRRRAVMVDGA
jgi:hypothetical protein